MKISVLGTGYVGLVTGACLSDTGNQVSCIDVDKEKVARLLRGSLARLKLKASKTAPAIRRLASLLEHFRFR